MTRPVEVENLRTSSSTEGGVVPAVDGLSFHIHRGETLGVWAPWGNWHLPTRTRPALEFRPQGGTAADWQERVVDRTSTGGFEGSRKLGMSDLGANSNPGIG